MTVNCWHLWCFDNQKLFEAAVFLALAAIFFVAHVVQKRREFRQ